jgi:signal transduction histidine kinase
VTCLAADHGDASAFAASLQRLLPSARVEGIPASIVAHADGPDCLVAVFGADHDAAVAALEGYRSHGGEAGIVLVVDAPAAISPATCTVLGVAALLSTASLASSLLPALAEVFSQQARARATSEGRAFANHLAMCQRLLAAGQATSRLPHRLNNPLAALLAEAELLRLEPLGAEQRDAVDRILEISHRLIEEVRILGRGAP